MMNRTEFSKLSLDERLVIVEGLYVQYPRVLNILREIGHCQRRAKLAGEAEGVLITGDSGAGKTTLRKHYARDFPRLVTKAGTMVPVLVVVVPVPATPKSLATELLTALGDPGADKGTLISRAYRLRLLLKQCGVELIILDEFQHFQDRDSNKVLRTISDWLKVLMDETGVPIVLIGMPYSENVLDAPGHEQLRRRFPTRIQLNPFTWSTADGRMEFRKFLKGIDDALPFPQPSHLADLELAFRCYSVCQGIIGPLMTVIRRAAYLALEKSLDCLSLDILAQAYDERVAANNPGRNNPFFDPKVKQPAKRQTPNSPPRATNSRSKARPTKVSASDIFS